MATEALQDRRVWIGGGGVVALVLAAASWLLFIHPELSSADDLRSQRDTTVSQNNVTQGHNLRLEEQSHDLANLRSKLVRALDALPPVSGLPEFTRELNVFSSAASVGLTSIAVGNVTAASTGGTTGTSGTATPATTDTTGSTSETTGTTPPTPTSGSATGGRYAITVTVQSAGSLVHQLTFLKAVESGPRRVLVTSSQVSAAGGSRVGSVDGTTTMTTQLTLFSAPMSAAQLAQVKRLTKTGS